MSKHPHSPLKAVFAPHLDRHIRLGGRRRPKSMHLYAPRIADYLDRVALPAPPTSTNYRATPDVALSAMYLNDSLGDCVIAARYHRIGQLTALVNNAKCFVATTPEILADYERVGGYVAGNEATDQGCDMVTNNNDAVSHGYADGSKDLGWLVVDGTNRTLMEQVIYLFEGSVDLGIEIPDAWINPFPSSNGFVWDVAGPGDPQNGHCVEVLDYDTTGIIIATWGLWGTITWAAAAKYLSRFAYGETYLHLNPDQIAKAATATPNGVAWEALIADFDSMGGHVPSPTPPTPVPVPPAPVPHPVTEPTLAQVEGWLATEFTAGAPKISRKDASKRSVAAVARNWPKG